MKARLLIVFAAILLLLPSMPGKGLAQENPKLRIEGECFGNNYIHVVVYMDNPPDRGGPVSLDHFAAQLRWTDFWITPPSFGKPEGVPPLA